MEDQDAQYYCNSADFLLTPRIHELNSGNITFGFTFGLVVVGKDSADIGEILIETGNPVFNPMDINSIRKSVNDALSLNNSGLGKRNQELAHEQYDCDLIARNYIELYQVKITS